MNDHTSPPPLDPGSKRSKNEVISVLAQEIEHYRFKALSANHGAEGARVGIMRLKRKIDARDEYIKAAEELFVMGLLEGEKPKEVQVVINRLKEARYKIGLAHRPKPDHIK